MVKLNKDHKARIENILNDISNIKKVYGTGISGKMESNLIREIGEFSGSVNNIINEKLNIPKDNIKSSSSENITNKNTAAMPSFMNKYYRSK